MRPLTFMFPINMVALADKGFYGSESDVINYNIFVTPTFLKKNKQFTSQEVARDDVVYKLRYTSEVAFGFFVQERVLRHKIPYHHFHHVHNLVDWGHAVINLQRPLLRPQCFPQEYFEKNIKDVPEESLPEPI